MDSKQKQQEQGTGGNNEATASNSQQVSKQDQKPVDPHFNPFTQTIHVYALYF